MLHRDGSRRRPPAWALALALTLATSLAAACTQQQESSGTPPSAAAEGESTAGQAAGGDAEQGAAAPTATEAQGAAVDGERYVVVAGESQASYRATEKFVNRELPNEAVGVSTAVEGELVVADGQVLQAAAVKVDLRELKSDSDRRDNRLKTQWLESEKFPWAEFTLTEPVTVEVSQDQPAEVELAGDLVVRDVKRQVVFSGTVTQQGEGLRIKAEAHLKMSDFGIDPPDLAGILKVDDPLTLEVDLLAQPAG